MIDLIEPNVFNIPTLSAGNKNVTQKIRKTKFMYPSSFNGSSASGSENASTAKR
jgi:hypothetical protein